MNKLIKASLIAAVFAFVVGCSTQEKPVSTMQDESSSSTVVVKHHKKCHGKKCHKKHVEKVPTNYNEDKAK
jgi:hypothetical protein